MYQGLGIHWASSVPAFLSLACVPFPFLFYKYGEKIRMKCKYAAEAAEALERMRQTGDDMIEDGEETETDGNIVNEKKEEMPGNEMIMREEGVARKETQ
jgi:hypothetical protein